MITAINWITAHWADILRIGGEAYVLASMLVALMPESWSSKAKLVAILERLSFLAHKDSPGTLKLPMTTARRSPAKPSSTINPPPLVGMLMALSLLSCAGSTTNIGATAGVTPSPGGVAWTVGVNVGINIAKDELPHLKSAIDARGDIAAASRQQIDHALDVAIAGLPVAQTTFNAIAQGAQGASVCLAHNELESAFTGAIQAMQLIRSLGVQLDPMLVATVTAAIGGLASYLDMLYPACASSGPPLRRASAQERLRAALGGQ